MPTIFSAFLFATALLSVNINAETIYIPEHYVPIGQQAADKQAMNRPERGLTKNQVKKMFGAPEEQRQAVGQPPISSWKYDDFTVYFEGNTVLHSVLIDP